MSLKKNFMSPHHQPPTTIPENSSEDYLDIDLDLLEDPDNKNDLNLLLIDTTDKTFLFFTVFKLLGKCMEIDVQGNASFKDRQKKKNFKIDYDIIIIDEVSMIGKNDIYQFFDMIDTLKSENKKVPTLIFLGDIAQLPPVKEKVSVIF